MSGEHPTRAEDFDLYALGALDDAERKAFESHLATCADCAEKQAAARGRMAILAFAAPRVDPSPGVKETLMRQVIASAQGPGGSLERVKPEPADGGVFARWWAVLLPAATAFALATVLLWLHNEQLNRQLAELRDTVQQQQKKLDEEHSMVELLSSKDTVMVSLAAQKGATGSARVLYNSKNGMMMYDGVTPPAPMDKSYQVWLVPMNGAPIAAGWFTGRPDKPAHMMMKLPEGIAAKAFAVTLEPAGGKPQPTGPMVLVGPVS
jgi:anti-sigma-K factor RskA